MDGKRSRPKSLAPGAAVHEGGEGGIGWIRPGKWQPCHDSIASIDEVNDIMRAPLRVKVSLVACNSFLGVGAAGWAWVRSNEGVRLPAACVPDAGATSDERAAAAHGFWCAAHGRRHR